MGGGWAFCEVYLNLLQDHFYESQELSALISVLQLLNMDIIYFSMKWFVEITYKIYFELIKIYQENIS